MESPFAHHEPRSARGLEHPLAACTLVAALVALATLAVTSQPDELPAPVTAAVVSSEAVTVEPSREALRSEFFDREVQPRIAETDRLNREAASRCKDRLTRLMDQYRRGIDPFVEDLTSISTRLGIVRRMPTDWWKQDGRVESYVQEKFERHLFSKTSLTRDVGDILDAFRTEVDANQKRMLISIRASLDTADLPEVAIGDYDSFLASVADQLQDYSSQQGASSVQNALTVLVMSEAGSYAAITLASGLLARFGAAAATTAAAAGGATAGASAAGAGSGSLGGPVGTAVGLGVGLVIGIAIDWWMTERFEDELSEKMHGYVDSLEQSILHGSASPSSSRTTSSTEHQVGGIGDALPIVCDRLQEAYQQRFRESNRLFGDISMSAIVRHALTTSLLIASAFVARPATAFIVPVPAVASSVTKALVKYFGREGAQEATEYLSKKGGQELVERVTSSAVKQGGDEAVEQVAAMASKYGPEALAALDNSPAILPIIRAVDELPEAQAKIALARLSAGAAGRELAEVTTRLGSVALRSELKHPGVGLILVRSLGDEGADLASRLNPDQAIAIGRHAEDLAKLTAAQRQGVLAMLRNDTEKMIGFVGRFVEANPGKTLFTAATTAVILAEPERILGGDEVVFDAEGNPIVVRKGGLADRAIEAGGNVAGHVSDRYLRPVFLTAAAFAGAFALAWSALKVWQYKKFKSTIRARSRRQS